MFRVGQKVVCVDARNTRSDGVPELTKDCIYTIAWVGKISHDAKYGVRLVGVNRDAPDAHVRGYANIADMPFRATRFRPIVERKTDISIFTAMLDRTSAPSKVEA